MLEASFVNLKYTEAKVLYYIDENFLRMDSEYLAKLYQTDSKLEDPVLAARHGLDQYLVNLEWIKHLQDNKIDITEYSIILLLVVTNISKLDYVINMRILVLTRFDECKYARVKLRPYLNQIFKSLNIYYNQNPDKIATRLGTIMSLMDQFQVSFFRRIYGTGLVCP